MVVQRLVSGKGLSITKFHRQTRSGECESQLKNRVNGKTFAERTVTARGTQPSSRVRKGDTEMRNETQTNEHGGTTQKEMILQTAYQRYTKQKQCKPQQTPCAVEFPLERCTPQLSRASTNSSEKLTTRRKLNKNKSHT